MSNNLLNNTASLQNILEALQNKAAPSGGVDTTDATATANDILSGKTAYANGQKIIGNIAFAPARTITPSATSQTAISAGYYANGAITVAGDSNLVADNIKKGISIFGVNGNYEGGGGITDTSIEDMLIGGALTTYTNDRVTVLNNYAFMGNESLNNVSFPNCIQIKDGKKNGTGVNAPFNGAFTYCTSLTSANFPVCSHIGSYAFYGCRKLISVSCPVCSYIGHFAFYSCTSLISISFPVCSYIGERAFLDCSKLTSVSFPVCSYIGISAFNRCKSLTSVNFPVCSYIGNYAFSDCSKLTSIHFPVCSYIGSGAFYFCLSLTSADFGGNSTISKCTIYPSAFKNCTSLTNLTLRYSFVVTLSNINTFVSTPMSLSTLTGSIYVPATLVDSYKKATNWATYADRITAIVE